MINNLINLLNYDNVYLIVNFGILPFWILLIMLPNHGFTNFFTQSIIIPLILAAAYIYVGYNIFLSGNILNSFELYRGLDGLYSMFSNEAFLLIFWIHFLTISLFVGAWIVSDSRRHTIPRFFTIISLIFTYFTGPVGLIVYWLIRIFFAKRISFND